MDVGGAVAAPQGLLPSTAVEVVAPPHVERLNPEVQQQLHFESVKIRALALYKVVSHILDDLDAFARSNSAIKWQDALGQFSMVSMELFHIVEDIKNVSKAFVVFPKNVNAENATGSCEKNTPAFSSTREVLQMLQTPGGQFIGRSVPSPSNATAFDNPSTPPMAYANSSRSDPNIMNTPSPQQQVQRQQQQRQKIMQLTHQQQLLVQQQFWQSSITGVLGQRSISQLHDITGQTHQKFQQIAGQHQMSYSHPMLQQQFQNGQLQTSHMSHNILQNQINQGGQLRSSINQLGSTNNALFNAAQASPNSQMNASMSASMQSQSRLPRMQFGLTGGHLQRNHPSQVFNDQMFGMGPSNPANMLAMQQQQQGGFRDMSTNAHNFQPGMINLSNTIQNPNFPQQQQNQQ